MLVVNTSTRNAAAAAVQNGPIIDFHSHCAIAGVAEMMGGRSRTGVTTIGPDRLVAMDELGIDIEVLSINPNLYGIADEDLAERVGRFQNEGIAEICAGYDGRFVGLATLPLQFPELAVQLLEEGVNELGLRGGSIGSSVGSEQLGDPKFEPFWAKAEELDVPIWLHPALIPELQPRLEGNGMLGNTIGNEVATAIALGHLIFEGVLDRYPGLNVVTAHGGGYLPAYAPRMDYGCGTRECGPVPERLPSAYIQDRLFFDSAVFTSEALRHLIAVSGSSQIVIGTDYPFSWTFPTRDPRLPRFTPVEHILGTPGLSDADRAAMLGGNAARLLKIPV
jgi:aminocarboxymuconate-semialdehyde decarboxylase